MTMKAWFHFGACLLFFTAWARVEGAPSVVYYFDNIDRPAAAIDALGKLRDINLTKDSHISDTEKRFGEGSLLIQKGAHAATAGWYASLDSIPEFAEKLDSLTITLWICPEKEGAIPLVRRSQHTESGEGVFAFYLDGLSRLVFSVGKERALSLPITVVPRQWTHLAVTFERGAVKFFVNGELWEAVPSRLSMEQIPGASDKGAFSGLLSSHPGLYLDDFGFFGDRALSGAEIKGIYADGLDKFLKNPQTSSSK